MKHILMVTTIALLCSISSACDRAPDVESDFQTGNNGWQLTTSSVDTYGIINRQQSGEYVSVAHQTVEDTWYWQAPSDYRGNLCDFYGGTLTFQLKLLNSGETFDNYDVIIKGRDGQVEYDLAVDPNGQWTDFNVPIEIGDGWMGDPDEEALKAVLGNVTDIFIRADYALAWSESHLADVSLEKPSWLSALFSGEDTCAAGVLNSDVDFVAVDPPFGVLTDMPAGLPFRLRLTFDAAPATDQETVRLKTSPDSAEYVFSAFLTEDELVYLTDVISTELEADEGS